MKRIAIIEAGRVVNVAEVAKLADWTPAHGNGVECGPEVGIGWTYAAGVFTAPPKGAADRKTEIATRLSLIDADSVRAIRVAIIEQAGGRPVPTFERNKLATLETEAAALRAELAGL